MNLWKHNINNYCLISIFLRFGNFLCNTQRELEHENIMRTSTSLWAHLDAVQDDFVNQSYDSTREEVCIISLLFLILPYIGPYIGKKNYFERVYFELISFIPKLKLSYLVWLCVTFQAQHQEIGKNSVCDFTFLFYRFCTRYRVYDVFTFGRSFTWGTMRLQFLLVLASSTNLKTRMRWDQSCPLYFGEGVTGVGVGVG